MMATRRFRASEESVGAARRFVLGIIVDAPAEVRDSVSLMVSELSTNALVHAATRFEVSVELSDLVVFVSVSDRGDGGRPVLQAPAPSEPHGRGLRIVDALSDEWGISPASDAGKAVWFRVSLQSSGSRGSVGGADSSSTIDHGDPGDQATAPRAAPVTRLEDSQAGVPSTRQRGPGRPSRAKTTASTGRRHRVRSTHRPADG